MLPFTGTKQAPASETNKPAANRADLGRLEFPDLVEQVSDELCADDFIVEVLERREKVFAKGGRQNTGAVGKSSVNHCPEWLDAECYTKKTRLGGRGIGRSLPRTSPTFAPL